MTQQKALQDLPAHHASRAQPRCKTLQRPPGGNVQLKTANLEDLVRRARNLAESVLEGSCGSAHWSETVPEWRERIASERPNPEDEARDLLSRIRAHEAIYETTFTRP